MIKELFLSVLNMSITASIAVVAVILLRFMLKKAPKIYSYALWGIVLFRLLCPYSLPLNISAYNFISPALTENGKIDYAVPEIIENNIDTITNNNTITQEQPVEQYPVQDLPEKEDKVDISAIQNNILPDKNVIVISPVKEIDYTLIAVYIWICGIIYIGCSNIFNLYGTKKLLKNSVYLEDNIYENRFIPTAFIVGLINPKIYIPANLTDEQKNYVIAHEKVHIKRKDYILKLLAFAALCLHWFNPFVWLAFYLSEKDMEMSCDEAVIKNFSKAGKVAYSMTLLSISTSETFGRTAIAFGEGNTKNRIQNVLRYIKPSLKYIFAVSAVVLTAVVAFISNPVDNSVYKAAVGNLKRNERLILYNSDYADMKNERYKNFVKQLKKVKVIVDETTDQLEIPRDYTLAFFSDNSMTKVYFDETLQHMITENESETGLQTNIYSIKDSQQVKQIFTQSLNDENIVLNNNVTLTFPALEIMHKEARDIIPFNISFILPEGWYIEEKDYVQIDNLFNTVEILDENGNDAGTIGFRKCEKTFDNTRELMDEVFRSAMYFNKIIDKTVLREDDQLGVILFTYSDYIEITKILVNSKTTNNYVVIDIYGQEDFGDITNKIATSIQVTQCDNYNELLADNRIKFRVKPNVPEQGIAFTAAQRYISSLNPDYEYQLISAEIVDNSEISSRSVDLKYSQNAFDFKYHIELEYGYRTLDENTWRNSIANIFVDEYKGNGRENYVIVGGNFGTVHKMNTPSAKLQTIEIERVVKVPYKTQTLRDDSMTLGTSRTSVKGMNGLARDKISLEISNGVVVSAHIIDSDMVLEPVNEVINQGTLWNGAIIGGGSGKFIWPAGGGLVSRGFVDQYPSHNGIDISGAVGTHIYAADNGVVMKALYTSKGYGNYIIIEHGGYQTLYAHCSRLHVKVGEEVRKGQVIAEMGSSGNSTGPHLHFEVKRGDYRYDPYGWF